MRKVLIGALLAATAAMPAFAQDGGWRARRGDGQEQRGSRPDAPRPAPQDGQAAQTSQNRGEWRGRGGVQADGGVQTQAVPGWQGRGDWRARAGATAEGQTPGWQGRGDWRARAGTSADGAMQVQPRSDWQGRRDWQGRDGVQGQNGGARRDGQRWGQQPNVDQFRRDGDRDGRFDGRRAPDNWRNDGRQVDRGYPYRGYNDGRRYDAPRYDNRGYRDDGRWNRDWRRDDRYDWNRYRSSNRYLFRLPRYYAPYGWDYGYRRFSIGVTLSSVLWGEDYWISDPAYYRLPPVWGPYRWVRYYNDALLVDLRTGLVVDTVYDIFW